MWRDAAALATVVVLALIGTRGQRVPLLANVDLGFHELGHMVAIPFGEVVHFAAGSFTQIAVPVGLALYFLVLRREHASAAVCFAWAGTSAANVAVYAADAPYQRLHLIGGEHDWAFLLGPDAFDMMDRAAGVGSAFDALGWLLLAAGAVTAAWNGIHHLRLHPDADRAAPPIEPDSVVASSEVVDGIRRRTVV